MRKTLYTSLILYAALALIACKKNYIEEGTQQSAGKIPVSTASVAQLQGKEPVIATGSVASKEEVILSFKTGGIVRYLSVDEGRRIRRGQQLARLDLQEVNARLSSAKFAYEKANRDAERARNLYRDTVGTLENYQNAQTQRDLAQSQYDIAQFNRRYSVINAPLNGYVLQRFVEEGELVNPGQPVYKVGSAGDTGDKIIRFGLSDRDIIKLKTGDTGKVTFDGLPDASFEISISEISETSNPQTGLFEVEASFNEEVPNLKNGFIGKVQITPSQGSEGLKVPLNALVEGSQRRAIIFYTTNQQTAQRLEVDVLDIRKDYFLIATDALPANANIIVKGAAYLRDQDSIIVNASTRRNKAEEGKKAKQNTAK